MNNQIVHRGGRNPSMQRGGRHHNTQRGGRAASMQLPVGRLQQGGIPSMQQPVLIQQGGVPYVQQERLHQGGVLNIQRTHSHPNIQQRINSIDEDLRDLDVEDYSHIGFEDPICEYQYESSFDVVEKKYVTPLKEDLLQRQIAAPPFDSMFQSVANHHYHVDRDITSFLAMCVGLDLYVFDETNTTMPPLYKRKCDVMKDAEFKRTIPSGPKNIKKSILPQNTHLAKECIRRAYYSFNNFDGERSEHFLLTQNNILSSKSIMKYNNYNKETLLGHLQSLNISEARDISYLESKLNNLLKSWKQLEATNYAEVEVLPASNTSTRNTSSTVSQNTANVATPATSITVTHSSDNRHTFYSDLRISMVIDYDPLIPFFLERNKGFDNRLALDGRNSDGHEDSYWEMAVKKYNDETFAPTSYKLSGWGDKLSKSYNLDWSTLTQIGVKKMLGEAEFKKEFTRLNGYVQSMSHGWNLSGLRCENAEGEDKLQEAVGSRNLTADEVANLAVNPGDRIQFLLGKPVAAMHLWYVYLYNNLHNSAMSCVTERFQGTSQGRPSVLKGKKNKGGSSKGSSVCSFNSLNNDNIHDSKLTQALEKNRENQSNLFAAINDKLSGIDLAHQQVARTQQKNMHTQQMNMQMQRVEATRKEWLDECNRVMDTQKKLRNLAEAVDSKESDISVLLEKKMNMEVMDAKYKETSSYASLFLMNENRMKRAHRQIACDQELMKEEENKLELLIRNEKSLQQVYVELKKKMEEMFRSDAQEVLEIDTPLVRDNTHRRSFFHSEVPEVLEIDTTPLRDNTRRRSCPSPSETSFRIKARRFDYDCGSMGSSVASSVEAPDRISLNDLVQDNDSLGDNEKDNGLGDNEQDNSIDDDMACILSAARLG